MIYLFAAFLCLMGAVALWLEDELRELRATLKKLDDE